MPPKKMPPRKTHSQSKVVLVTGAAKGIGKAIVRGMAAEGWKVGGLDVPESGIARQRQAWFLPIEGDVAQEETATQAVKALLRRWGRLDAVISNAGIMARKPLARLSLEEWNRVLATNLTAAFLLARAAEKPLRKAGGSFVSIASTRWHMSEPDTESYAASKGGLVALTHALAVSLGPDVRVNAISPGWIATQDYSTLRKKDHAQHPVGRVGRPADIAHAVAWLLDREKSGFITGANLVIDGGMTRKMIYVE